MELIMLRFLFCFPTNKTTIAVAVADPNEIERCVICHRDTPYRRGDPIDMRDDEDYVVGVGPTCPLCLKNVRDHSRVAA
jgi:hypothetical protein